MPATLRHFVDGTEIKLTRANGFYKVTWTSGADLLETKRMNRKNADKLFDLLQAHWR